MFINCIHYSQHVSVADHGSFGRTCGSTSVGEGVTVSHVYLDFGVTHILQLAALLDYVPKVQTLQVARLK